MKDVVVRPLVKVLFPGAQSELCPFLSRHSTLLPQSAIMPGGVCAVLDYEVEVMAEYVTEMSMRVVSGGTQEPITDGPPSSSTVAAKSCTAPM